MTADENARALEFQASLARREVARKRRLLALSGNPAAARRLRDGFAPVLGNTIDAREVRPNGPTEQ